MAIETSRWISGAVMACASAGMSGPVYALDKGDVLLQVHAIDVVPNDSSSTVTTTSYTVTDVGVNYAANYKEKSGINGSALNIDNPEGAVAQARLDWSINKKWFANLALKHIDMSTAATVSNATDGATVFAADVKINPWVLGLGIGTTF